MKLFNIYLLIIFITSCTKSVQPEYYRTWKLNFSNQEEVIFRDTVKNGFMTIDSGSRYDTTFFKTCFEKPLNLWIKGNYSASFYKIILQKIVNYKNDSVKLIKCISSADSSREDHILSFLVLENIGIIYEANPSMRTTHIMENMYNTKMHKRIIDNNYVKSIYIPNLIPSLNGTDYTLPKK